MSKFGNFLKGAGGVAGNILEGAVGALIPAFSANQQAKIEAKVAKYNTDKTIEANKELAEYAYSKDVEMWNNANSYNSPEAQMQRLKEAGLNPNLVYGTGAVGNSSASLPHYQAPNQQYNYRPSVNLPAMLNMFQDFRLRQAQIDNVRAQVQRNNTENAIKAIDLTWKPYNAEIAWQHGVRKNDLLRYQSTMSKMRNSLMENTLNSQIQKFNEDVRSVNLENKLKEFEIKFMSSGGKFFNPIIQGLSLLRK